MPLTFVCAVLGGWAFFCYFYLFGPRGKIIFLVTVMCGLLAWTELDNYLVRRAIDSRGETATALSLSRVTLHLQNGLSGPSYYSATVHFYTTAGQLIFADRHVPDDAMAKFNTKQPVRLDYLPDNPKVFRFRDVSPPPINYSNWILIFIAMMFFAVVAGRWYQNRLKTRRNIGAPGDSPGMPLQTRLGAPSVQGLGSTAIYHSRNVKSVGSILTKGEFSTDLPARWTPDQSASVVETALGSGVDSPLFVRCPRCDHELPSHEACDVCPECDVVFAKLLESAKLRPAARQSPSVKARHPHFARCPKCKLHLPRDKAIPNCPECGVVFRKLVP